MAKINNIAAYETVNPTADSIVIGSTESDGDTKNFLMSAISTFVLGNAVTPTLDDVCQQGASTTTGITVAGTATLNGVLDANSTADISGNTTIGGTLGVTGASTLDSVAVTNNATVGGTLGVTGVSTLGEIDASGVADIADTLTLSRPSGTGLSLPSSSISVGGSTIVSSTAVTADSFQTNTASFTATSSAVQCSVAATFSAFESTLSGTTTVNGALDANSTADIADTLTLSKATGNGLAVTASADIGGNLVVSGSLSAVDIATFFQNTTFNQGVILNDAAPTSPTDTGIAGEIAVDADYIYVCTATNTWKRVALAAWTP